MLVKETANAKEVYENIFEQEFDCTLDEGWTVGNHTLYAELYLELSAEGKKIFAMQHAEQYADKLMLMEAEEFINSFSDQYGDLHKVITVSSVQEAIELLRDRFLLLDSYYPAGVHLDVMERVVACGKGKEAVDCISRYLPVEAPASSIDLFIYERLHHFINYYE